MTAAVCGALKVKWKQPRHDHSAGEGSHLMSRRPHDGHRRRTDHDDVSGLRALVVEDDDNYRAFVCTLLRRAGIEADTVSDGEQALEHIRERPAYDLLLIDYEMPRMDGLQLIRRLRHDEATASTFAVMLTARGDVDIKIAALNAGFDDFLLKASTELELLAKVTASKRILVRQQAVDVTVRHLRGLSQTDELTGLHNRRFFLEETERALRGSKGLTLVLFDLDEFKQINDTFGHLAGDLVLKDVASVLKRGTRYEDFIARYGGDEFIMLAHELPLADVDEIIRRVTAEVEALRWPSDTATIQVSLTAGVSTTELLHTRDLRTLLDASDRDLYKNKFVKKSAGHAGAHPSIYEYGQTDDATIIEFRDNAKKDEEQPRELRVDRGNGDE